MNISHINVEKMSVNVQFTDVSVVLLNNSDSKCDDGHRSVGIIVDRDGTIIDMLNIASMTEREAQRIYQRHLETQDVTDIRRVWEDVMYLDIEVLLGLGSMMGISHLIYERFQETPEFYKAKEQLGNVLDYYMNPVFFRVYSAGYNTRQKIIQLFLELPI